MLKNWNELPKDMQTPEVRKYYDILKRRKKSLALKRCFDVGVSGVLLLIIWPVLLVLSIMIRLDSPGPVFFRQVRVTSY